MKLADLRRLSIRRRVKIHFRLQNGMECIVNEGVAQVPGLQGKPDFNLEEELSAACEFLFEPPAPAAPRRVAREELASMSATGPAVVPDHEEE
ncbi:MAG TPA: hypothetical protein VMB03_30185 [Bryobacteraceae bacterium]|nr:hypothetical protein [Bryobacteraceae bacterium]